MHEKVILSLSRDRDGISAWVCSAPSDQGPTHLTRVALALVPLSLFQQRDALLADWHRLRTAIDLASVWPAFWRVFWSTLCAPPGYAPAAMPQRVTSVPKQRATAAHPRAFRGTKFQPPKPAAPILELCTWLSDDRLLDGFFARHDFARLPALDAAGQPLQTDTVPTVSSLLARSGAIPAKLPDLFRRSFHFPLKGRAKSDVLAWFDTWRCIGSPTQGPELAQLAVLCAHDQSCRDWVKKAAVLQPVRRISYLDAISAELSTLPAHATLSETQLMRLDAETVFDDDFRIYIKAVLSNLGRGVRAAYSLQGCTLAYDLPPWRRDNLSFKLRVEADCSPVPMEDILRMHSAAGPDYDHWKLRAWECCSTMPGFDRILRETRWEELAPNVADQWMAVFSQIAWDEQDEKKRGQRWRAHLDVFPAWNRGLTSLPPEWKYKYVRMLSDHASGWENAETLHLSFAALLPLQLRLCSAPFSPSADGDAALSAMAEHLPAHGWRKLLEADNRTWLIVERAYRRDNDSNLINRGLHGLALVWPEFVLNSFTRASRRLMRTARLLGCLAYERRRQFLSESVHEVWFATDWLAMPPLEACRNLYRLCLDSGMNSPVPRRLREHFEGKHELTAQQIARHCRVSLERLPVTLLEALDMHIWRRIDAGFNLRTHSSAANHAVRLLASLRRGDNRQGLRRFLLNYREGRVNAYLDHPLNLAWFARHPKIDSVLWTSTLNQPADGAVTIALETDPLEVLMLGTYVGSCLGLGGVCDYSAVACLLDANKQVLYARDASGTVVARQLLAIDERDRLVCFNVYPLTADGALLCSFKAYNTALAAAMGVELYVDGEEGDYKIVEVVSEAWWDDGLWTAIQAQKPLDSIVTQVQPSAPTSIPS